MKPSDQTRSVCACIYLVAHKRAVRPCCPSHFMPLKLFVCASTGVYYFAHNHAIRPRPAVQVTICYSHYHFECLLIVHKCAIRPCCPSYCCHIGPPKRGSIIFVTKYMITRGEGDVCEYFILWRVCRSLISNFAGHFLVSIHFPI